MYAARVRAPAEGESDNHPPRRLRTRHGVWLHARAPLEAQTSLPGHRAGQASEVAPLIVEAYALTHASSGDARDRARARTDEIAIRLLLSEHTVRDHVRPCSRRSASRAAANSCRRCSPRPGSPVLKERPHEAVSFPLPLSTTLPASELVCPPASCAAPSSRRACRMLLFLILLMKANSSGTTSSSLPGPRGH